MEDEFDKILYLLTVRNAWTSQQIYNVSILIWTQWQLKT